MIRLLLHTNLFLSLPNDCLCQINGEPLIHIRQSDNNANGSSSKMKRLPEGELSSRPCKRRKLHQNSFVANPAPRVNKRVLTPFLLSFLVTQCPQTSSRRHLNCPLQNVLRATDHHAAYSADSSGSSFELCVFFVSKSF